MAGDDIPAYIRDGLDRQGRATLEEIVAYCHGRLAELETADAAPVADDPEVVATDSDTRDDYTRVVKRVTCGDESCACASGDDADKHGPYEYRVRRRDGRLDWEYVGPVDADS
ncbi:hypothetical protein BRD17_09990 [Halobacteriales archaeon SW_7_68_16]|nr:MAG: hypothetical protein BRD17_09990 [Halobacteriales archaeon SW_7_68_16]